ncbi:MAG: DegT/DnrJ/EryC1/StrS family aminotransferase [Microthrixaceae bacterium]
MTETEPARRIEYAGSVHDEREIEAVVEVLRGGPTALRIGRNVRAMESRVAELFAKQRGVMVNSGSSALYLAIEVLDLAQGDEVITSPTTFSTDIAPMVRGSGSGVRGRHPRHVPDRRGADRGDDRSAHTGDPGAEPDRQCSGLGPDPGDRRCA